MQLDFSNVNTVWSSLLVETLNCLGLNTTIICPGSRSTPLTVAFAKHPNMEAIPILDERSAAFFALGIAKRNHLPVALVCTSGTAGANFYPAVIEAKESGVPLLIFTADRPPELQNCHAGQAIDQVKLYGHYCNWQTQLAIPSIEIGMLRYLRQTMVFAWERSLLPNPGVVHVNCPFREPLAPVVDAAVQPSLITFDSQDFLSGVFPQQKPNTNFLADEYLKEWSSYSRGIIIVGLAHPKDPKSYCQAIAKLAQCLNFPVLADVLSPVRNFAEINPNLITTYDIILRNSHLAQQLVPDIVIQIGELPTSKELRQWLEKNQPRQWIVSHRFDNFDSLHNRTVHIRAKIESFTFTQFPTIENHKKDHSFLNHWERVDQQIENNLQITFSKIQDLSEAKISWLLPQILPKETSIFIANSMPIRYTEFFWLPNNRRIIPYFNRGANGIDGTLSSALGIAHNNQSSVLLTGDLALLHDTNGFLIRDKFKGHLTIILVNNNGGGIFEMLPIAQNQALFEDFFATPQNLDFSQLCATYRIEYKMIENYQQLEISLTDLSYQGIRVLEIPTNRKQDTLWLKTHLSKFAKIEDK